MQPVHFSDSALGVTAHTRWPLPTGQFAPITTLLAKRDVDWTIDFLTGDFVEAHLPDGTFLDVVPRYDEAEQDRVDYAQKTQTGWFVGWQERGGQLVPLYDSQPGQLHQEHGTDTGPLLACINEHLDDRGIPSEQQVRERLARAESLLHRAGFVSAVQNGRPCHRLPAAMVDNAEHRAAVTRAIDYLRAEGFGTSCPADLVDSHSTPATLPARPLDRLGEDIATAGHPGEVVAALSELTAPEDGVLDQVVSVLHRTANWWEGLDASTSDRHYAARLRHIADGYAQEVRALRGDLADRHAAHPQAAAPAAASTHDLRVAAALASSPVSERTLTGHPAEAPLAARPPAADRSAGRSR